MEDIVGEDYDGTKPRRDTRQDNADKKVHEVIASTKSEGDKIDEIAVIRGWFASIPETDMVKVYMAGERDAESTVALLADPIDRLYSTADHGRALLQAERVAANQRQHWSAEEAEERWGTPQDLPDEALDSNQDDETVSAESELWGLWYTVLHNARKTPWQDTEAQDRLVDLVRTFKQRPDPAFPANATKALRNDWIWSDGKLWSNLTMLGPSARESWNDGPGPAGSGNGGSGYTDIEIQSWLNINAFVARLTITGLYDFWAYGIWALRDTLESEPRDHGGSNATVQLAAGIAEVEVWMRIAGVEIWKLIVEKNEETYQRLDPEKPNQKLPWTPQAYQKDDFTWTRWVYWKSRLRVVSRRLSGEARKTATEIAELMDDIDRQNQPPSAN